MNLQEMIIKLQTYWAEQGCIIYQPYDLEVGAGTMSPATFCGCWAPPNRGERLMCSPAGGQRMAATGRIPIGLSIIINTKLF